MESSESENRGVYVQIEKEVVNNGKAKKRQVDRQKLQIKKLQK